VTADELVADLSLVLMYLSAWKERPSEALRFWKGFRFEILNQLADEGLIADSRRAKSAFLTGCRGPPSTRGADQVRLGGR
jgi:hypothetical protein